MKITLTMTNMKLNKSIDVKVNEEQEIKEALKILDENVGISDNGIDRINYVRSKREKKQISVACTFRQANIFTGDHLLLEEE